MSGWTGARASAERKQRQTQNFLRAHRHLRQRGDNKQNFLKLLMRFARSDLREHRVSDKRPPTFVSALQSIGTAE